MTLINKAGLSASTSKTQLKKTGYLSDWRVKIVAVKDKMSELPVIENLLEPHECALAEVLTHGVPLAKTIYRMAKEAKPVKDALAHAKSYEDIRSRVGKGKAK